MNEPEQSTEEQIAGWRAWVRHREASVDLVEMEGRLRQQVARLVQAGLASDEAFLVAVKRLGYLDPRAIDFTRGRPERSWNQLAVASSASGAPRSRARRDGLVAFCLAVAAAAFIKVPALFGITLDDQGAGFYIRNAGLFVLPLLTGYFAWKRRLDIRALRWLGLALAAAGVFANVYPMTHGGQTEALTALHLPIALWLVVGVAYAAGRWRQVDGRMDFIRFSGELFIYYVLIALGGGVFTGLMAMTFQAIGIKVEPFLQGWLVPCGAAGAVLIGSWLVEARQGVIENMAPVLTRLFTPLFAALLVTFLAAMLFTGRGVGIDRNVLITFDLLLVVVLGLLLYSLSARDPGSPPGVFDALQIVLVVSALLADAVALWAIAARVSEFGFTPNRVAALGENMILLVNLAWSAVLSIRFQRGHGSFSSLEKWQTDYLPVYLTWAAIVVTVFPPLFGYI